MSTEKQAISLVLPGLIGGGVGAAFSPSGRRGEGFVHGMSRGVGTDVGASVGGLAGGLAGLGIGAGLSNVVPEQYKGLALTAPAAVGLLGGAGLGGYGGYHAGAGIGKAVTGKNAPWRSGAKKKPAPKKEDEKDEAPAKAAALNKTIEGIMAKTDLTLSEKAAAVKAALGDPNRSWGEWWDGQEDDLTTAIGVKKSPAALAQNIRFLENSGRTEDAARLRAALPSNYDPNSESNPYRRVAESRQGLKPVAGSRNDQAAAAAAAEPKPAPAPAAPNHYMNAGLGAAAGGAAGAMLGPKNRVRNALLGAALGGAGTYAGSHLASGGNLNTMLAGLGLGGKTAAETKTAFDFGKMLGEAGTYAKNMYNQIPEGIRSGMGMGGLGGAALGGLAGLMAPGVEDVFDEDGNVVGRRRRGRFGAALRGALGGGVLGAGAGAAAGHFAPNQVNSAMNYMQQQGRGLYQQYLQPKLTSTPQSGRPGMPGAMMA